jgi:DNA polymerase III alpha subunit (gram-positive type)
MHDNKITLALDGDVTLRDFSNAMVRFKEIVDGLKNEIAPDSKIDWVVEDLKKKCAIACIKGIPTTSKDIEPIQRIKKAYTEIGRQVVHGEPLNNGYSVVQAVIGLRSLINGRITSIRFETSEKTYTIKKHTIFAPSKASWSTETFGCVRGRVESISKRQYLHFTLYDYNDDHPIQCFYTDGQKEKMRNIWDKLVYVEGAISRDEENDLVNSVNDIASITIIKERKPQEWRNALGCLK